MPKLRGCPFYKSKSTDPTPDRREPNQLRPLRRFWHLHSRLLHSAAFGIVVALALRALSRRQRHASRLGCRRCALFGADLSDHSARLDRQDQPKGGHQ